jgi:hypothetical protein
MIFYFSDFFHQFCIAKLKAWANQAVIGVYTFTHANKPKPYKHFFTSFASQN